MHIFDRKIKGCNGDGEIQELNKLDHMKNPDYENFYIDHYYSKSLEEFVEKINQCFVCGKIAILIIMKILIG